MSTNGEANKHPILPQLREAHQIGNFNAAGVWEHRSAEEAKNVYEGLKIEQVDFQVNSIPDIWARPILFEMALFEPGPAGHDDLAHPLHKRIRGEWRGLLALLAVREWRGISDLAALPVFKGPQAEWAEFLKVAATLKPTKSLADDTRWIDIHAILLGGQPIAITSPTTLVCTATDYAGRISKERVPWFNGHYLEDPTACLSAEERRGLAAWLERLSAGLSAHAGLDHQSRESDGLLAQLRAFVSALVGGLPAGAGARYPSNTTGLDLQNGIFRYLRFALREREADPLQSHVRLMPSVFTRDGVDIERRKADKPHWLILDERIAKEWEVSPNEVAVWGAVPLSAACADFASVDRARIAGRALRDAVWLRPDELFLDRIYVISQKGALPGSFRDSYGKDPTGADQLWDRSKQDVTALVPLKDSILDYLSPADLSQRITFAVRDDGNAGEGITVTLRLPLAGAGLNGRDFIVTRHYSFTRKDDVTVLADLPVLEIWPNFTSNGWKTYFCYYSNVGNPNMFGARPYAIDASMTTRSLNTFDITRVDKFPEAVICSVRDAKGAGTPRNAGLILLASPKPVRPVQHLTSSIGVDFGTTGTRLYSRNGNAEPSPITFRDHSHCVIASGTQRAQMYYEFLPADAEPTESLLSLFHDFCTAHNPPSPVLDGHVYFIKEYAAFNANRSEISKNMKWGNERERTLAGLFLQQLCLQAAAEAVIDGVTRVNWRFSFPSSFSQSDRRAFSQIWRAIMTKSAEATGLRQSTVGSSDESTAAARFFAHRMGAPLDRGTVCIDIGGGTSDIAIWQRDNQLRCQASVRLAGRDILLYPVYAWPEFLKVYFKQPIEGLAEAKKHSDPDAFYAQADAMLKASGDSLLSELPEKHAHLKVKEFVTLIDAGLCGLFYYVGLLLKGLNEQGRYEPQMPNVYLGGNAAKLLHWCALGQFAPDSEIDKRLKGTLLRATGFPNTPFDIEMSVEPKAEVAYGLLIEEQFVGTASAALEGEDTDEEQPPVISGEAFSEDGVSQSGLSWITAAAVHRGLRVDPALASFEAFISCLRPKTELDAATRQRLVERTNNELINDKKRPKEQIRLQPPFVAVLKHYLAWRADSWAAGKSAASGGNTSS